MIFQKLRSSIGWRLYTIFLYLVVVLSVLCVYVYSYKKRDALIYDKILSNISRVNGTQPQVVEIVGDIISFGKPQANKMEKEILAEVDNLIRTIANVKEQTDTGHQDSIHYLDGVGNILVNFKKISNDILKQKITGDYSNNILEDLEYLNIVVDVYRDNIERYVSSELLHTTEIRQGINQWNKTFGLLLAFFVLFNGVLVVLLILMVQKTIINPIQSLEQSVHRIRSSSTFSKIEVNSNDEIGSLSMAFNEMTSQLNTSIKELNRSEEKYRDIFENAIEGIFQATLGDNAQFISANPALAQIMGYDSPEEILCEISRNNSMIWVDSQDRDTFFKHVKKGVVSDFEVQLQRRDGQIIWVSLNARPVVKESADLDYIEGTILDITERKNVEHELATHREHLEELVEQRTAEIKSVNKELETFTYSVSHDLKAPLRGIDGYSRLLLEEYSDKLDDEGKYFLNNVREGAVQMSKLIEDLLSYSRMERKELHHGTIDLTSLIDGIIRQRAHDIEERKIEMRVDVPFQTIESDTETLRQVLANYLDNAIKYSKPETEGTVTIGGAQGDQYWSIWVKDSGIGFDPKYLDRIFEIFQRLHRVEEYPGTGVGLAIVRKAVERIGGRVRANSSPGKGSTFYLDIPKNRKVHLAGDSRK